MGLAAVGKTSYFEVLQQEFGALYSIKPTIGMERNKIRILGTDIYIFDYGGQQKFRNEYLKESNRYLNETDLILFFIDIQNMEDLDGSFNYFNQLMDLPELKSIDPTHIFILLHKSDPEIRNDPRVRFRVKKIKDKFSIFKNINFFETSIHDYWSIIFSFSGAFKTIIKVGDVLNKLLKEFARATFSSGIILIDKNFLILDKHASNEENLRITEEGFELMINKWAKKAIEGEKAKTLQMDLEGGKGYFQEFNYEGEFYYIMSYSRNPRTEKLILEKLPELANRVFEILMGFYFEEN